MRHGQAQFADRRPRRRSQCVVQRNAHALAALGVKDRAFLDAVAVLFEQKRLKADLDALRFVSPVRDMRALAAVVDRRHRASSASTMSSLATTPSVAEESVTDRLTILSPAGASSVSSACGAGSGALGLSTRS